MQESTEVIDLCSSSDEASDSSSDECYSNLCNFSPIKPKTVSSSPLKDRECNDDCTPMDIIKGIIPNVHENDFHDESKCIPVLSGS